MVKKIKKRVKRPGGQATWSVPFDDSGQAGVYIHKHGDGDDHSDCGPVVLCCDRAAAPYRAIAPDLHSSVTSYKAQRGSHLCTWLDSGVNAMYFVLCDPKDENAVYQFGLSAEEARPLLLGQTPHAHFRRPEHHFSPPNT
jgi:hypothetical protein